MFGRLKNWLSRRRKRKVHDRQLEHFIGLLRQSEICTEQQVGELISKFANERREVTSDDDGVAQFCRFLVATNAVTTWQCDKLKKGKWKGFHLDDYLMLESIVRLIVTPMNQTRGSRIEYLVERHFD